jgi:sulfate permease, SulP family
MDHAYKGSESGFIPKSYYALKHYSASLFFSDLIAGVTVGLVALPLAMAFAISSGVKPESGLYCAIVAGFLISALGGSRMQIGGPTGAFVVVVTGIVTEHGLEGLFTCTLMAGVLLVLLGVTRLGSAIKYIPRPVVIGFTNGIAVLIASTQLKDFFGLNVPTVPGDFLGRLESIYDNWPTLNHTAVVLSIASLFLLLVIRKFFNRVPGSIIVLVLGTGVAWNFALPVETIHSRFGGIPSGLPEIRLPTFRWDLIFPLLSPTLTVMMLGAIESLLSAVVADRMSNDKHNPNMELVAQGIANIASPLFGGLPATGAIARTATNIRSGARSPVAGMIHATTLLVVILVAAPLAQHIPLSVLAAILLVVAYNMGEWGEIPEILRLSKPSRIVWGITFALTVFADLTVAVQAGMILAMLLYIQKVTGTTSLVEVTEKYVEEDRAHSLHVNEIPKEVVIFRIFGPFLFGATDKLDVIYERLPALPNIVVLRLRDMNAIDATGLHALETLADKIRASGRHLILCGMREQPSKIITRGKFQEIIGRENLCSSLKEALERAAALLRNGVPG